jgi:hypothetical protein
VSAGASGAINPDPHPYSARHAIIFSNRFDVNGASPPKSIRHKPIIAIILYFPVLDIICPQIREAGTETNKGSVAIIESNGEGAFGNAPPILARAGDEAPVAIDVNVNANKDIPIKRS